MPAGPSAHDFYARTMEALNKAGLPFLVGGGYALGHYTGVERDTKDFDIFVRRDEYEGIMQVLSAEGFHTELTFPHWLGKASCEHGYVDVIFSSGNGVSTVDDLWFTNAVPTEVFGVPALLCPVEETIWSKAFILERERNDTADVMHLLLACATSLDWVRLLRRFGTHWRVLLSHLCLFGFIYPTERDRIPQWVLDGLMGRLGREVHSPPSAAPAEKVCQGTLLSREQYLVDVQSWGYVDVRHTNASTMTPDDVVLWTQAIEHK